MPRWLMPAFVAVLALAFAPHTAQAQVSVVLPAGCGTAGYGPGVHQTTMDATGQGCVAAAVSATITGFQPGATGAPITAVVAPGATGNLPAGLVVVVTNTGTVNAYCKLGATATVADQIIPAGGGWFAFTRGAATQLTCLTAADSTVINMVGGTGLPTGAGGAPVVSGTVGTYGATLTLVTLDNSATGAVAVDALTAGHRNKGGWIKNPVGSPALCINERGTALTTEKGDTTCIAAGLIYQISPNAAAVSVISADSGVHDFSGYGFN